MKNIEARLANLSDDRLKRLQLRSGNRVFVARIDLELAHDDQSYNRIYSDTRYEAILKMDRELNIEVDRRQLDIQTMADVQARQFKHE